MMKNNQSFSIKTWDPFCAAQISTAIPGAVDPGVLSNLALATVLSTIPGLIAAVSYSFLRVTRATHDATRAAIDLKKHTDAAGPVRNEG